MMGERGIALSGLQGYPHLIVLKQSIPKIDRLSAAADYLLRRQDRIQILAEKSLKPSAGRRLQVLAQQERRSADQCLGRQ
jgi:hypothetical protein